MPDDIEALQRWMQLPETNLAAMDALTADYMAPSDYVGEMKVQKLLWSETDE